MALHRPPLICNRFEVVLIILLSFIVSTRLIWLQIDERPPLVSDEFYATSNAFKRSLGQFCSKGVESQFPYSPTFEAYTPLATGSVSPGLEAILWSICQSKRLTVGEYMDSAPLMIGMSAFLVAITARLLTSTWVGGFIAASVVLSRGSILQGTHLATTAFFQQVLVTLVFLISCLYLRSRDARWLPFAFVACIFAILLSPIFSLASLLLALALLSRSLNHALKSQFSVHRFRLHLFSIVSMLLIIPALVFALRTIMPASTSALSSIARQLGLWRDYSGLWTITSRSFVTWLSEIKAQDFHFQVSLGIIAIAATWKRYLPRGSGFWALTMTILGVAALTVDGALRAALLTTSDTAWPLGLKITGAMAQLEPLIVGTAAAYSWFAARSLIVAVFPSYSSPPTAHDRIR